MCGLESGVLLFLCAALWREWRHASRVAPPWWTQIMLRRSLPAYCTVLVPLPVHDLQQLA